MQLDRIGIDLRRRSPWEAIDLGLPFLHRCAKTIYAAWFGVCAPIILVIFWALWEYPWVAILVAWWLKPFYDRILLAIYADALFRKPPGLRDVWRRLPGLARNTGLLGALTIGRFSMHRSFHLPVRQLEGQRGAQAAARRRLLNRGAGSCAVWLSFVCANLWGILQMSVVLLVELLRPRQLGPELDWAEWLMGDVDSAWLGFANNLAWLAAESLVEPFYVAAGFTLYLNRRNDLEGWDIELGFRRLAARQAEPARTKPAAAFLALAAAAVLAFSQAEPARAATESTDPKAVIGEVLADPVFGREVPYDTWRYRGKELEDHKEPKPVQSESLDAFFGFLAVALRWLSYVAAVILAITLAVLLYRHRDRWLPSKVPRSPPPMIRRGILESPESLPGDPAGEALRLAAAGQARAALSLLYRSALAALTRSGEAQISRGYTEQECLERASQRIAPPRLDYLRTLLDAWSLAAYGGQVLESEHLKRLCLDWRRHFAPHSDSAS